MKKNIKYNIKHTLLVLFAASSFFSCAHTRPIFNESNLSNGKIIKVPLEYKPQNISSNYELIRSFNIIEEAVAQPLSEERALEKLQKIASENNADFIIVNEARSEYAKSALLTYTVQTELIGNLFKKKK
jgi:hypothetical protein